MFIDCSVFILACDGKIFRLEVDHDSQKAICETFSLSVESMINGRTARDFEVNYKPEDDEVFRIENFLLKDEIKDCISDIVSNAVDKIVDEEGSIIGDAIGDAVAEVVMAGFDD